MPDNRKYCIVPGCTNTTTKTPNKRFINVPKERRTRRLWLKAVRTENQYSMKTTIFVCEDHFNLEDEAENFLQIKYGGSKRIRMRQSVVPHIFECQSDRRNAQPVRERPAAVNKARRSLVQELKSPQKDVLIEGKQLHLPASSECSPPGNDIHTIPQEEQHLSPEKDTVSTLPSPRKRIVLQQASHLMPTKIITPRKRSAAEALCELASSMGVQSPLKVKATNEERWFVSEEIPAPSTHDAQIIAHLVKERSKSVKAKPSIRSRKIQCQRSPMKKFTNTATSPFKVCKPHQEAVVQSNDETTSHSTDESSSSYKPSGEASSGGDSGNIFSGGMKKQSIKELHIKRIQADPMYYIGVPPEYYYLIDQLAESVRTNVESVLICLQKIRLNQGFKGLAYDYGVSESFCSKTFCKVVPDLAKCLSTLILWPDKKTIKRRIPIYFSARYADVQSIIDCFEIEIEKPSDPVNQTLTWSNYKKANTLKYFISSTPDGYINFVSGGFGGRTSDAKITETCGYLDVLPDNSSVMADRGFKGIAAMLQNKSCTLVRPPSVSASEKCTKDQVKLSKRIASLRIHIERVIRRLREFSMVRPHACINHYLCKYTDCIVQIVCGLVNLQQPLIKKFA